MRAAEERVNRRGHALVCRVGVVGEHREHLLDEQRVALGRVDDAAAELRSDVPLVHQPVDQLLGLRVAQRSRARRASYAAGVRPRTGGRRRGRGGRGRAAGSAHRSRSRARTRAGRAASARPSGCRPRRRRAAVQPRASRTAGGTPTRSPPESRLVVRADRAQISRVATGATLDVRQEPRELRLGRRRPATSCTTSASGR